MIKDLFDRHNKIWRAAFIVVGVIVSVIQFLRIARRPPGDFPLHWTSGHFIASGQFLYTRNINYPYPPFWGFVHSTLAWIPMETAYLLVYPLFFAALYVLVRVLNRLSEVHFPLGKNELFWLVTIAILLSSRYLIRDMLECGVNLALVAAAWLSVYLWREKKELQGSLILGFAMALKCTPSLFWVWFILKREWKMAGLTFLAAACFTLSPMLKLGYAEYDRTVRHWVFNVMHGFKEKDPSKGIAGPVPIANMSLRITLARYLMHFPREHEGRMKTPLYVDFLNLPPVTAGRIISLSMLVFLIFIAWLFRRHYDDRSDERILWECAVLSILILLYSPVTWGQHCVGIFPGVYLLIRSSMSQKHFTKPLKVGIGLFVFLVLILNRAFIGKFYSELLGTYHTSTFLFLGIIGFLLSRHFRVTREKTAEAALQPAQEHAPVAG
ncbi:glycosyltransferase family 87 protein [Gimesia sp.]|uniref:glycosyltransferase family 87 protein n=1 Tax=Gimesia sp. TaxID=2024833 RepID=UPI0032EAA4BD